MTERDGETPESRPRTVAEWETLGAAHRAAGKAPEWTRGDYLRGFGPVKMGPWHAANNGAGARPWFILRESAEFPRSTGHTEYHEDARGDLIRYTTQGAFKKAAQLNTNTKEN